MDTRIEKMVAHHDWWADTYDDDYFGKLSLYHQVSLDNVRRFVPEKKRLPYSRCRRRDGNLER